MIYEAEANAAGALRGGIYDDQTKQFQCHIPAVVTVNVEHVALYRPIAVSNDGKTRIIVYPNESDSPECFTGRNYETGDLSAMWERAKFSNSQDAIAKGESL